MTPHVTKCLSGAPIASEYTNEVTEDTACSRTKKESTKKHSHGKLSRSLVPGMAVTSLLITYLIGWTHPHLPIVTPQHHVPKGISNKIKRKIKRKLQLDPQAKIGDPKRTEIDPAIEQYQNGKRHPKWTYPASKNQQNGKSKQSHIRARKNGDPKYDNFSIGHHTIWTRIWPFHKWRWSGL
jgi:hypothetical protein